MRASLRFKKDFLALLLLFCLAFVFVWPLFTPNYLIPQGGGDLVLFLWPNYRYAAQHLNLTSLISNPQLLFTNYQALLWNSTLYSGAPFVADNQNSFFYPPHLILFALFPDLPYQALEILVALHLFLAGAGMYVFMSYEQRAVSDEPSAVSRLPSFVAAVAFMLSDVFVTHLGNYNIVAVSAYLPFIFLGLRQALKAVSGEPRDIRHSLLWSLFTSVVFSLAILAGHAQMTLIIAFACALYGAYELFLQRHYRVLLIGAFIVLLTLGLSAISLLPTFEMLRYTARLALDYAEASRYSLDPLNLVSLLNPNVIGRGARAYWLPLDRVETGYVGITVLVLALLARKQKFFIGLALVSLLIAFGAYTPVHQLLYQFIPGFASVRVPARFVLLTDFALAALAGFALMDLRKEKRAWLWGATLAALAAVFIPYTYLRWHRQPDLLPLIITFTLILIACVSVYFNWRRVLTLAVVLELFIFGAFVEVDQLNPAQGYTRTPAVDYLLAQPAPFRIDLATTKWQPNLPQLYKLESIYGIYNPLLISNYFNYYWSVDHRGSPRYNFLNVQYVVADKNSPPADATFVPVFNEDPNVDVYLNTNTMPRVSLIYDAVFTPDPAKLVFTPSFDPAKQVVLEATSNEQRAISQQPSASANLFYTNYRAGHFTIVTQTSAPAYLVLSEVWYPTWQATLNGKPVQILRANTAFMAVLVPAGESTVEFNFTSPSLLLGAIMSGVTFMLVVVLFVKSKK